MNAIKVCILSAHRGAKPWTDLCDYLTRVKGVNFMPYLGYSDRTYRNSGTPVKRLFLRLYTFIFYPILCTAYLLFARHRHDAVIAVSSPFFLPFLCSLLSKRPVLCLHNDIYPEALYQLKLVRRGSSLSRLLERVRIINNTKCAHAVYLCESHRRIACQVAAPRSHSIIPVGSSADDFRDRPMPHEKIIRYLYCGTLGLFHNNQTLLDYIKTGQLPSDVEIDFRVSGAGAATFAKDLVDAKANIDPHCQINVGPPLAHTDWMDLMSKSHVGIVSQGGQSGNVIFPSKTYTIMMAGQAVLAIADPNSDVSALVRDNECGWVVPPGDIEALHQAIQASTNVDTLYRRRLNAYNYARLHFDIPVIASKWLLAIQQTTHRQQQS